MDQQQASQIEYASWMQMSVEGGTCMKTEVEWNPCEVDPDSSLETQLYHT